MLLYVLIQCADGFARTSGCNHIRMDVSVDYASGSDDDVIAYSDTRKDDSPASDEAVPADSDGFVDNSFRILAGKIAYNTSRRIVGHKRAVE